MIDAKDDIFYALEFVNKSPNINIKDGDSPSMIKFVRPIEKTYGYDNG